MPTIDTYKKQAKLLVRWHREGNFSVAGRIRQLDRHSSLSDREALALPFPLSEAQEVIALEEGCASWAELKTTADPAPITGIRSDRRPATLAGAIPVLHVVDVEASASFYRDQLRFGIDFLHGVPPFYGSVSRDNAKLHLKLVDQRAVEDATTNDVLIMAFIEVPNVRELYAEFQPADVKIAQKLTKQAWGGTDFIVLDPDGNGIAFVG